VNEQLTKCYAVLIALPQIYMKVRQPIRVQSTKHLKTTLRTYNLDKRLVFADCVNCLNF